MHRAAEHVAGIPIAEQWQWRPTHCATRQSRHVERLQPDIACFEKSTAVARAVVYQALQESTPAHRCAQGAARRAVRQRIGPGRMEREVALLARLRHPNIVTIHDKGVAGGATYFVMDYIDGAPLDRWAKSVGRSTRAGVRPIVEVFTKVCGRSPRRASSGRHSSRLETKQHPGHTIRARSWRAGLCCHPACSGLRLGQRHQRRRSRLHDGRWSICPDRSHGSPEQVGAGVIDRAPTFYSLGVTLYQALTGTLPYVTSGTMAEAIASNHDRQARRAQRIRSRDRHGSRDHRPALPR